MKNEKSVGLVEMSFSSEFLNEFRGRGFNIDFVDYPDVDDLDVAFILGRDYLKNENPKLFQVNLIPPTEEDMLKLVDKVYVDGIKAHANLTITKYEDKYLVLTPEKSVVAVDEKDFDLKIPEIVQQRASSRHYKTNVTKDNSFYDKYAEDIAQFREDVTRLWSMNMFEEYYAGAGMHFGFVAKRVDEGFLITSRGSDKENMPLDDIVLVEGVDWENKTLNVRSRGKKASLNANVTARLFEERPDVDYIVHSHNHFGFENKTEVDYSPGTQEDVDEVVSHLSSGESTVELENHGVIILGKNMEEIMNNIDVSPAYNNFPELYDAIYHRFHHSKDFFELVNRELRKDSKIMDLGCGTGEVILRLLKEGYKNLAGADLSEGMLRVMTKKLENNGFKAETMQNSMLDIDFPQVYEGILVRQAINYLLDHEQLVEGFKRMHDSLVPGGKLIFNSPNYLDQQEYPDKVFNYALNGYDISVHEKNSMTGRILTHTQRCLLVDKENHGIRKLFDINRFALYTPEEFRDALQEAGFSKIRFYTKGLQELDTGAKSLYCVAEK